MARTILDKNDPPPIKGRVNTQHAKNYRFKSFCPSPSFWHSEGEGLNQHTNTENRFLLRSRRGIIAQFWMFVKNFLIKNRILSNNHVILQILDVPLLVVFLDGILLPFREIIKRVLPLPFWHSEGEGFNRHTNTENCFLLRSRRGIYITILDKFQELFSRRNKNSLTLTSLLCKFLHPLNVLYSCS